MTAVKSRLPSYLILEDELGKPEPDKVSQESYIAVIMYRYLLPPTYSKTRYIQTPSTESGRGQAASLFPTYNTNVLGNK